MNGSLYLENPNVVLVEVSDAENATTNLAAATVQLTLALDGGADVAGIAWPVAMAFVSGTTYAFRYKIPETLTLVDAQKYVATVTVVDATSGLKGTFKKHLSGSELFV